MVGEDEFRAILNRIPDGVVAVDHDLRVAYFNAAAARFFHPAELLEGVPLPTPTFDPSFRDFVQQLLDRDAAAEKRIEAPDQAFLVHGIPPHGRQLAAVVLEDVFHRTRRDRARSEFVANVAHELLTPMTGIVSVAHVLESGAKEVPEMRDRFLDHILRESNRLTRVARGLLTLARSESGEEPPRLETVELRALLEAVLDGNVDATSTDVRCAERLTVLVDRDLTETALSNLIANAFRHAAPGSVSISCDELDTGSVSIVIATAGNGLDPGDVTRLRRRFTTGSRSDGGGFGLGMSIATQAIEAVGGTVTFEFTPDGSRTEVVLPAAGQ